LDPAPSSILVAIEFALVAEQPLVAHSWQRRLSRHPPNDCEHRRDQRPAENRLENPPDGAVGKRKALDVRGHDSPRVASTSMPTKTREKPRVILRFLRNARVRALKTGHLWEGQVAQLVEHMTENHGVGGSIPSLATSFYTSPATELQRPPESANTTS
jgi:hypothetical protein